MAVSMQASTILHPLNRSTHASCSPRCIAPSLPVLQTPPLAASHHVQGGPLQLSSTTRAQLRTQHLGGGLATRALPFDQAWAPSVDVVSLAPQFFAASLFPYLAFLFFLHNSGKTPPITLFGFYFLLAFVGATIPAGIYAKVQYGTNLANVDWLHGLAESLLTITNLLIVLGLRKAIREESSGGGQQQQQQQRQQQQSQQQQPVSAGGATSKVEGQGQR